MTGCCAPRLFVTTQVGSDSKLLRVTLDETCSCDDSASKGGNSNFDGLTPCGHDVQGSSS